jgi:putative ABC transport system permease protein
MSIFLIESGLLGLIGGIIGIVIGLGLAKIVERGAAHYYGIELIKASMNPCLIGGAALFSFVVGVLSGLLPAKNAAELDPVEALRYE